MKQISKGRFFIELINKKGLVHKTWNRRVIRENRYEKQKENSVTVF